MDAANPDINRHMIYMHLNTFKALWFNLDQNLGIAMAYISYSIQQGGLQGREARSAYGNKLSLHVEAYQYTVYIYRYPR